MTTVVLRRGNRWLDRRPLNWSTRGSQAGVEFVIAPENRLQALVIVGENRTTEFKEHLPAKGVEGHRKVMKTVAAFANGAGGRILFGVTDDGDLVGLPDAELAGARDTLARLVTSWISPLPQFEFETLPVADQPGRSVIVLSITSGDRRPSAQEPDRRRRSTTSVAAQRHFPSGPKRFAV